MNRVLTLVENRIGWLVACERFFRQMLVTFCQTLQLSKSTEIFKLWFEHKKFNRTWFTKHNYLCTEHSFMKLLQFTHHIKSLVDMYLALRAMAG